MKLNFQNCYERYINILKFKNTLNLLQFFYSYLLGYIYLKYAKMIKKFKFLELFKAHLWVLILDRRDIRPLKESFEYTYAAG